MSRATRFSYRDSILDKVTSLFEQNSEIEKASKKIITYSDGSTAEFCHLPECDENGKFGQRFSEEFFLDEGDIVNEFGDLVEMNYGRFLQYYERNKEAFKAIDSSKAEEIRKMKEAQDEIDAMEAEEEELQQDLRKVFKHHRKTKDDKMVEVDIEVDLEGKKEIHTLAIYKAADYYTAKINGLEVEDRAEIFDLCYTIIARDKKNSKKDKKSAAQPALDRGQMLIAISHKLEAENKSWDTDFLQRHGVESFVVIDGYPMITFLEPLPDDIAQVENFYRSYVRGELVQSEEGRLAAEKKEQERQERILQQNLRLRASFLPLIQQNLAAINPDNPQKETPDQIFDRLALQVHGGENGIFSVLNTVQIADNNVDYFARFFLKEHPLIMQIATSSDYGINTINIAAILHAINSSPNNVFYFIYRSGGGHGISAGHFQSIVANGGVVIIGDPLNGKKADESVAQIEGMELLAKVIAYKYGVDRLFIKILGAEEKITQGQDLCCNILAAVNGMIEAMRLAYLDTENEAQQVAKLLENLTLIFDINFSAEVRAVDSFDPIKFAPVILELNNFYSQLSEEDKSFLQKKFALIAEISREINAKKNDLVKHPAQEIIDVESQANGKVVIFLQQLQAHQAGNQLLEALQFLSHGLQESSQLVSVLQYQLQVNPEVQIREESLLEVSRPFAIDPRRVEFIKLISTLRERVVLATEQEITIPEYAEIYAASIETDEEVKALIASSIAEVNKLYEEQRLREQSGASTAAPIPAAAAAADAPQSPTHDASFVEKGPDGIISPVGADTKRLKLDGREESKARGGNGNC